MRLILDPRCLMPAYIIKNDVIYLDAIDAITRALTSGCCSYSDEKILGEILNQVNVNRYT